MTNKEKSDFIFNLVYKNNFGSPNDKLKHYIEMNDELKKKNKVKYFSIDHYKKNTSNINNLKTLILVKEFVNEVLGKATNIYENKRYKEPYISKRASLKPELLQKQLEKEYVKKVNKTTFNQKNEVYEEFILKDIIVKDSNKNILKSCTVKHDFAINSKMNFELYNKLRKSNNNFIKIKDKPLAYYTKFQNISSNHSFINEISKTHNKTIRKGSLPPISINYEKLKFSEVDLKLDYTIISDKYKILDELNKSKLNKLSHVINLIE